MKKIGFIGAYDKTDLIIYIAKILTVLKKKVLVVDSTVNQKARYIVPAINPTMKYITEYEEIDIAVGFLNEVEIKEYLGVSEDQQLEYDMIFVDVDSIEGFEEFNLKDSNNNFFVTCFDVYSLKRGLEILSNLKEPATLTKVLFSKDMLKEDEEYLDYLSLNYKVIWKDYRIYLPIENGDLSVIYENQRLAKIRLRKLSAQYKDSMSFIIEEILDNTKESEIRKAIRLLEKGA